MTIVLPVAWATTIKHSMPMRALFHPPWSYSKVMYLFEWGEWVMGHSRRGVRTIMRELIINRIPIVVNAVVRGDGALVGAVAGHDLPVDHFAVRLLTVAVEQSLPLSLRLLQRRLG